MPLSEPIFIQCRKVGAQGGTRKRVLRLSSGGGLALSMVEDGGALSVSMSMDTSLVTHSDLAGLAWNASGHTVGTTGTAFSEIACWSAGSPTAVPASELQRLVRLWQVPVESGFAVSSTWAVVTAWASIPTVNNRPASFSWNNNAGELTVLESGTLEIVSKLQANASTNGRSSLRIRVQKSINGGQSWSTIAEDYQYNRRDSNIEEGSAQVQGFLETVNMNDRIRIVARYTGVAQSVAAGDGWFSVRLY